MFAQIFQIFTILDKGDPIAHNVPWKSAFPKANMGIPENLSLPKPDHVILAPKSGADHLSQIGLKEYLVDFDFVWGPGAQKWDF